MNSGEIGTQAGRIFEYNLPNSWIFRSQEDQNDFGIDGEIEIKDSSGKAIGKESVFKVQIKGEEQSNYIKGNSLLSFTLKLERLRYYFEFKVPVILIVVEVSSEKIYWLPLTNDEDLRVKAAGANSNEFIQIHIPVENTLIRKDDHSASRILDVVTDCWDYLDIKGLKESIIRYPMIPPATLNKKIEDIGEALFKAYHQQLHNLLSDKKYNDVLSRSFELYTSAIVPDKDRFTALLYYWQAFQISPFTNIKREIFRENYNICSSLISLARDQKSRLHRLIAFGKSRQAIFKIQIDQLYAHHHSVNHFKQDSFEHYIFNNQTQEFYRKCCLSLQKIIELCNRVTRDGQFHILTDLFVDVYPSIFAFKGIHKARGSKESIKFLDDWSEKLSSLVMTYCVISGDINKTERLYLLLSASLKDNPDATKNAREIILSSIPEFNQVLNEMEQYVINLNSQEDFFSLSIQEQKNYFLSMAKNLGLDPDDTEGEHYKFMKIGFANYDPTIIMKNCESLFVHYRPGGLLAQSLRMHSLGGMHMMICLKHGHAQGTGNLLNMLYDNTGGPDFGHSFKQSFCDKCSDCRPRNDDWSWTLGWYERAVEKHSSLLDKYKI